MTTLLRTESGLPVLVERTVGRGRVLLLTGTLDLGWGTFPLQSSYALRAATGDLPRRRRRRGRRALVGSRGGAG